MPVKHKLLVFNTL